MYDILVYLFENCRRADLAQDRERALAASGDALTLEQFKLIALMVLWNQQTPTSRLFAEDLFQSTGERRPN